MDDSNIDKWSLPAPSISEEGTFCDNINDSLNKIISDHSDIHDDCVSSSSRKHNHILCRTPSQLSPKNPADVLGHPVDIANSRPDTDEQRPPEADDNRRHGSAANGNFGYNRHNESIFDDLRYFPCLKHTHADVVKFDHENPELVSSATLMALIVQLTSPEVIDYNLICDFFLTYRTFSDSRTVLELLLTRLIWALHYVNSSSPETEKIGKLVLLRTFVVLRHWILNYFYDDFQPDSSLCDSFSSLINGITLESGLVSPQMPFELKILSDLKIHWLSQINHFFDCSFAVDSSQHVYAAPLPSSSDFFDAKKLTKSNTEASIHTTPSFRRSAMLSLYDQKVHHKCIVYEESSNGLSRQVPISNLVNQHKSSRISLDDKLKDFNSRASKRDNFRTPSLVPKRPLAPKHNYMNLSDSSLALKKTANPPNTNHLHANQTTSRTPIVDVKSGFSTNGRVKLPSSRISVILPTTPVKKMGYSLKEDSAAKFAQNQPGSHSDFDDFGRKKSLKKIVESWTKSLYSPDLRSDKSVFSNDSVQPSPEMSEPTSTAKLDVVGDRLDVLSARIIDELEFVIRYYIYDSNNTIVETGGNDDISRNAIPLSKKNSKSMQLSPTQETESNTNQEMSIHDISDLNIEKIDNIFSRDSLGIDEIGISMNTNDYSRVSQDRTRRTSKRSSFGGRITSINWTDDGNLSLEHSASIGEISKRDTKYFDSTSEAEQKKSSSEDQGSSINTSSFGSDPSDIEQISAEVADLGIAMSSQSLRRTSIRGLPLHDSAVSNSHGKLNPTLFRNSSGSLYKRDSMKSYVSYDSAYSVKTGNHPNETNGGYLKKKNGCHDLRKLAQPDCSKSATLARLSTSSNVCSQNMLMRTTSTSSYRSRSSSLRKSARFSTLCALTELPFNDTFANKTPKKQSNAFEKERAKSSDMSASSIFSQKAGTDSRIVRQSKPDFNRLSTSSIAIPGISSNVLKELALIPDESFSSCKNPIQCALYKLEGKPNDTKSKPLDDSSKNSMTEAQQSREKLPLSHTTSNSDHSATTHAKEQVQQKHEFEIMEDETGLEDQEMIEEPVNHTPVNPQVRLSKNQSDLHLNTEEILEEINNAVTEDVIEYSSDIEDELRRKPVTPIKTKSRSVHLASQSASNVNTMLTSLPHSESGSPNSFLNPKLVLDGYSILPPELTVSQVLERGSHVSFILRYESRTIAEHFTIIERDMMQEIDWKELIELNWNKELTPVNSWLEIIVNDDYYNKNKGVNLVIARFNLVVNWIISEILLTKNEEERRAIISRLIHVAHHSYEIQNFSTLMQVVLALTSEKINKLKDTWNNLSPGDILTLKHLENLTSPLKNFINIRLCTNQIKPSIGCIPFVGLYLSDLVFNAERPKFVKTKEQTMQPGTITTTPNTSYGSSALQCDSTMETGQFTKMDRLINFSRFRTSVHIVKSLSQSIEWSQNYQFALDDELLRKCLYIKSLDEEEMNYCLDYLRQGEQV